MISLRCSGLRKGAGAFVAALLIAALPAPAAPPAKAARKAPVKRAEPVQIPVARALAPDEFADAYPSGVAAGPDLQLHPENARKAEALALFCQALLAEDDADTEKALARYRKVLELDPGSAEIAIKVALELARRNDVPGAIQVLKDTIKAAPKEVLPLIFLSQLYFKQLKKPELALKYAEQALALEPQNFDCYRAVFELHMARSEPTKAEATLEKAEKVGSTEAKFWAQLGELYSRLYFKEDWSCLPDQLQKMNTVYGRAAELAGDDASILSKVGDYFVLSKQVKEAIPYYLKVVASPQAEKDLLLSNTRNKLARAFIVNQQRDEAIEVLERMAKEDPMRFDTCELLGELYEQKGEFDRALRNYEHSLLLDASQPQNYLRLTFLLLQMKKPERAVDIMKQARKRFPDIPQITKNLAVTLSQANRHTDAMTTFAEAEAEAENNHDDLLNYEFYLKYGAAAERAGLTEKAAELLKQSIELEPNNAEAYNYLGYMWADRGEQLDEAAEMIKKALELDPDNGAFIDSLGWLYFKKGEYEKALKELQRAAEVIKPEDAVVFDHLADTYQALSKTAEALNLWQKALALSADDKEQADKISGKIEAAKQKVTSGPPPAPPKPAPVPEASDPKN
jgi:tetratricopeptide (TPR) repeat protein